jgi:hypothetical protein
VRATKSHGGCGSTWDGGPRRAREGSSLGRTSASCVNTGAVRGFDRQLPTDTDAEIIDGELAAGRARPWSSAAQGARRDRYRGRRPGCGARTFHQLT